MNKMWIKIEAKTKKKKILFGSKLSINTRYFTWKTFMCLVGKSRSVRVVLVMCEYYELCKTTFMNSKRFFYFMSSLEGKKVKKETTWSRYKTRQVRMNFYR